MNPFPKLASALQYDERKPDGSKAGWLFLRYGRVAHYLRDGVTLCGKFRVNGDPFLSPGFVREDRCKVCVDFASDAASKPVPCEMCGDAPC